MWLRWIVFLFAGLSSFTSWAALSSGTGFFLTSDGYIATNHHVVDRATAIAVRDLRGRTYPARLIRSDEANDLAILKIDGSFTALPLARSSTTRRGDSVFTLGFPNTGLQGLSVKLTDGVISSTTGLRDEPTNFQISVPIQPGNSGGPLINREGAVVGVVVAKLSASAALRSGSTLPEMVNYAVKSNYLLELIDTDSNLSERVRVVPRTGKDQPLAGLVAKAEPSLVLVVVESANQGIEKSSPPSQQPRQQPNQNRPSTVAPDRSVEADAEDGFKALNAKNYPEAFRLLGRAARQGDASSQTAIGVMYETGSYGVAKDEAEAVRWYRKAAEQGYVDAQDFLGAMYWHGRGVAKDGPEASRWFRRAAEQGKPDAQHNLGVMYASGQDLIKDEAEAFRWFRRAAEQGHADAQYMLGVSYFSGRGVAKNETEGSRWLRKAAEQGNESAQKFIRNFGLK